jgi:putative phosphoesterase
MSSAPVPRPSSSRAPKTTHAREALAIGERGAGRLVLVADTHGNPHPRSGELIAALKPDFILHAGDIGDLAVLDRLAEIAPVKAVRGNIDGRAAGLPDAMTLEVRDAAGPMVTLLLVHIAVSGPLVRGEVARLAHAEHADVVVCGHSHVPFVGRDKGLVVVNPGSIGPRRFHLPIVFGVVDVSRAGLSMHHVSCETGERWQPVSRAS